MTFTSYAQNFEDVVLWRVLRHVSAGCYLDIGANDPLVDSVSRAFYEQGWRGVHLEPTAQYATLLRQNRPDELVIQAAVGDSQKLLTFFEFPDTGLSTLDKDIALEHQARGFRMVQTVTPTLTLDDIFAQLPARDIHWLKIDVEGAETSVLQGWQTSEVRPWIVVIESTLPMSQTPSHQQWEALLLAKGYQFAYFDGLNRYYVSEQHPELMAQPWLPPNVFDGFTIDGRASNVLSQDFQRRLQAAVENGQQSAAATLQDHEQARQTLLNQLAQTRTQLELEATSAREEYQALSSQVRDARDELGQMVRLVSQREQEFAHRFEHFQTDYQAVSQLLQQEREQASTQLQALQQQLQTQQQQYQAELQRHSELEDKLSALQLQLRQKEQAFAGQLLQLHQQKSGQQKVFQIREQSLRTELQRAREEILRVGEQYQAELQDLRQTHDTLRTESASWQQQYLQLQQESAGQMAQLAAALQQSEQRFALQAEQSLRDFQMQLQHLQSQHEIHLLQAREQFERVQQSAAEYQEQLEQNTEEYEALLRQLKAQHAAELQESTDLYEARVKQTEELSELYEKRSTEHAAELRHVIAELDSSRQYVERHKLEIEQLNKKLEDQKIWYESELVQNDNAHQKEILGLADHLNRNADKRVYEQSQILHRKYGEQLFAAENTKKFLEFSLIESQASILDLSSKIDEYEIELESISFENKKLLDALHRANETILSREESISQISQQLAIANEKKDSIASRLEANNKAAMLDIAFVRRELDAIILDSTSSIDKSLLSSIESIVHYITEKYESSNNLTIESTYMINSNEVAKVRHVSELLNVEGEMFVKMVFINILDRFPDVVGLNHYLSQLYAGKSKINVIYQVAMSAEGRKNKNRMEGLEILLSKCSSAKLPVIGRLLQPKIHKEMSVDYDYIRSAIAKLTKIESKVATEMENLSNRFSSLDAYTHGVNELISNLANNNAQEDKSIHEPVQKAPSLVKEELNTDRTLLTKVGSGLFDKVFGEKN